MADIKSPEERSRNMAKIRSRDTKPEDYVREQLAAGRIRVLVIWECTVNRMMRSEEERQKTLDNIARFLDSNEETCEL